MAEDTLVGKKFGRYEVLEKISAGRISTVYKARQPGANRLVALKVLPKAFMQDDDFRANFEREARLVAQLEHYHILPIYDVGEEDGAPFIAMRFLGAGTLTDAIKRRGRFTPPQAVPIIQQAAAALEFAHQRGIIHRDIKPSNILLDDDGNAYVSDFSLKHLRTATLSLTRSKVPGAPAYLAPEIGNSKLPPGPSLDIYALGCILFEMLVGRPPYVNESPVQQAMMHIRMPVPKPSQINNELSAEYDSFFAKALAKNPDDRFETAFLMSKAFTTLVGVNTDAVQRTDINKIISDSLSTNKMQALDAAQAAAAAAAPATADDGPITAIESTGVKSRQKDEASAGRPPRRRAGVLYWLTLLILALLFFAGGSAAGLLARQRGLIVVSGIAPAPLVAASITQPAPTAEPSPEPTAVVAIVEEGEEATPTPEAEETPTEAEVGDSSTPEADEAVPPALGGGGGLISFSSDRDGDFEVFLYDITTEELSQVTNNEGAELTDRRPTWAPDGATFAYDSNAAGNGRHIYLVTNTTLAPFQLTSGVREDAYPLWSMDGQQVLFRSRESTRIFLRLTSLDGAEELISQLPSGETNLLDWTPDGELITYYGFTFEPNVSEIMRIPFGGASPDRYPITRSNGVITHVDFSPDRSQVVFTQPVNNRPQIFIADGTCEVVNLPTCIQSQVTDDNLSYFQPRFSPDGTLLLVGVAETPTGPRDLWIIDLQGEQMRQVTSTAFDEVDGDWQPLSPVGEADQAEDS